MLLTMQQIDDLRLSDDEKKDQDNVSPKTKKGDKNEKEIADLDEQLHEQTLRRELEGVTLRTANWKLVEADQLHAKFSRKLPEIGLEIIKTYRLAKVPDESAADADFPAYHLEFEIEIRNIGGDTAHKVAYRLDGPNGLPTEGAGMPAGDRNSGGSGLRDFVISMGGQDAGNVRRHESRRQQGPARSDPTRRPTNC